MNKRKDPSAPATPSEDAPVQAARTRAKRRLIGAAVLVGIGVIGFPLLFETQPRPIAVDIPIEIPAKDAVAPLVPPAARPASAGVAATASSPAVAGTAPAAERVAATAPPAASSPTPMPSTTAAAAPAPPTTAASAPGAASVPRPAPPPAAAPVEPARPAPATDAAEAQRRDAQRAQDLLDGKAPAAAAASEPKSARYVVQAGAYTDASALREARQKVERLGLKTYTQVVETDGGSRTRVRVGPFPTREEAEKASARIKSAGLPASILSL